MRLQDLVNSSWGVRLGLFLGQRLPARLGYTLAYALMGQLASRRKLPIVQAVRLNQSVVRGLALSSAELDEAVTAVFRHAAHCFVDLYHNIASRPAIDSFFPETPGIRQFIERSHGKQGGTFVAILHMSNFDLAVLSLADRGLQAQILTFSQPPGSYQVQNRLRSRDGLEITPISNQALHRAIQRLKSGGMVITAIDRPLEDGGQPLTFFGHLASLPTGHIRMALKADVPIILAVPTLQKDGKYAIFFSDPIWMRHDPDPGQEIRMNARLVLEIAEGLIRQYPEQWLMYYPVWPDQLQATP